MHYLLNISHRRIQWQMTKVLETNEDDSTAHQNVYITANEELKFHSY